MLTIFVFIVVLAVLVLAHECGHFFAAKAAGVKVEEFGIGFPPRIYSVQRGETRYSLNAIPLGGFVKIHGENGGVQDDPRSFASRSVLSRLWIISAGVVMNVVLAFVILAVGHTVGLPQVLEGGESYVQDRHVAVLSVLPGTPAAEAELKPGDRIVAIDATLASSVKVLQEYVSARVGNPLDFKIERQGEIKTLEIIPQLLPSTGSGGIGVGLAEM